MLDAVWVFAHRGGTDGGHVENTIAAFAEARARGAEIETDVRLSVDGVPVLFHDRAALRGRWPVVPAWWPAVLLRRAGVPTIDDLYRELGSDYELSIDLKVRAAAAKVVAAAERAGAVDRLWLVHDSLPFLSELHRSHPGPSLVHETKGEQVPVDRRGAHAQALVAAGVAAQNTHTDHWDDDWVEIVRRAGLGCFGSIAHDRAQAEAAGRLDLDAVYADRLELVLGVVGGSEPRG